MKLIKARLRGLTPPTQSEWFELDPRLTVVKFSTPAQARNFLHIFQTINPPYDIEAVQPFEDFPQYITMEGYTRHVNPTKRTISIGVFEINASLVSELSMLTDLFYSADRIEVGRRLNYSRWMNFVELASSTRWSEISDNMDFLYRKILKHYPEAACRYAEWFGSLKPVTRIKGEVKDKLKQWVAELPDGVKEDSKIFLDNVIDKIHRIDHFMSGREIISDRMPLFVKVGCKDHFEFKSSCEKDKWDQNRFSPTTIQLLQLLERKVKEISKESAEKGRFFIQILNNQLDQTPSLGLSLRLDESANGEITLHCDEYSIASDTPQKFFQQLGAEVNLARAVNKQLYKTEPLLMFDTFEWVDSESHREELARLVLKISESCQCLCVGDSITMFSQNKLTGKIYKADELGIEKE